MVENQPPKQRSKRLKNNNQNKNQRKNQSKEKVEDDSEYGRKSSKTNKNVLADKKKAEEEAKVI